MDGFLGFLALVVIAALTYEAPLFVAGVFGERTALVQWWVSVSGGGDTAAMIVFIASYIVIGFTLWAAPLWYVVTILRPEGGAGARQRTGAVLSVLLLPLMPLWDRLAGRISDKIDARRDLKEMRTQYRNDFRDMYPTFEEFLAAVRRKAEAEQEPPPPPPPPPPRPGSTLQDAEQLLGLKPGYTAEDLKTQHRALIKRFHTDDPGARLGSDIAQRINSARDIILDAKDWKK